MNERESGIIAGDASRSTRAVTLPDRIRIDKPPPCKNGNLFLLPVKWVNDLFAVFPRRCCEKSLMHSYSIFIGTKKNNKDECEVWKKGGRRSLKAWTVIRAVDWSAEINAACKKQHCFCSEVSDSPGLPSAAPIWELGGISIHSCTAVCTQHTTVHFNRPFNPRLYWDAATPSSHLII